MLVPKIYARWSLMTIFDAVLFPNSRNISYTSLVRPFLLVTLLQFTLFCSMIFQAIGTIFVDGFTCNKRVPVAICVSFLRVYLFPVFLVVQIISFCETVNNSSMFQLDSYLGCKTLTFV